MSASSDTPEVAFARAVAKAALGYCAVFTHKKMEDFTGGELSEIVEWALENPVCVRAAPDLVERKSSEDRRPERDSDVLDSPARPDLEGMQEWHSAFIDGRDVCTHYSPRPMDFITVIRYALYMESRNKLAERVIAGYKNDLASRDSELYRNKELLRQADEELASLRSRAEPPEGNGIEQVPVSKETERRVLAYGEVVAEANTTEVADGFTDPAEIDLLNHIGTLEGQVDSLRTRLSPSEDVRGLIVQLIDAAQEWQRTQSGSPEGIQAETRCWEIRDWLSDAFASRDARIAELEEQGEARAARIVELHRELASLKARMLTPEEWEKIVRFGADLDTMAWSEPNMAAAIRSKLTAQEESVE